MPSLFFESLTASIETYLRCTQGLRQSRVIVRFLCFPAFAASPVDFFCDFARRPLSALDARRRAAPHHRTSLSPGRNFDCHVCPLVLVIVVVGLSRELALPPSSARLSVSSAKARPFYSLRRHFEFPGVSTCLKSSLEAMLYPHYLPTFEEKLLQTPGNFSGPLSLSPLCCASSPSP